MNSKELAWLIRRHGIEMTHLSGGSHIGAILSVADIMGVLYTDILKFDSSNPEWDGRDRFILSKGHAGASVYAAIAENGFSLSRSLKLIMQTEADYQVMYPTTCPELIFQRVLWDTAFLSLPAGRLQLSRMVKVSALLSLWVMVSATKVLFGRRLNLPTIISLTTLLQLLTITICRALTIATTRLRLIWLRDGKALDGMLLRLTVTITMN